MMTTQAEQKFQHPDKTADGKLRAQVAFTGLETLWVNTGTLCNVECAHCYIESSPQNDRLTYITATELEPFLNEAHAMGANEIGFTGGEPFMNPHMVEMTEIALERGFQVLILTNAMRPMMRPRTTERLPVLQKRFGNALAMRVSVDHYTRQGHDTERGTGSFDAALIGIKWLTKHGFSISIAGRGLSREDETQLRAGFAAMFREHAIALDANDPASLILFPEMDEESDVPEITTDCWGILEKSPTAVMCASSRMLVKRKGASSPVVLSCTLLPYDRQFEMGDTLGEAAKPVKLNHPFCAQFCVLGDASCSG
ncbi:radical SAM protein [Hyphococcus lacteus]|uniref:Radical SAM protein n=1 Tax=Hyphococcus lacteus TaxID=3143536 RepID=A0ABV3Z3F2_9PROT